MDDWVDEEANHKSLMSAKGGHKAAKRKETRKRRNQPSFLIGGSLPVEESSSRSKGAGTSNIRWGIWLARVSTQPK